MGVIAIGSQYEYTKKWREKNRERWNETCRQYYQNHKEKMQRQHREYYAKNRERIIKHNMDYCKRKGVDSRRTDYLLDRRDKFTVLMFEDVEYNTRLAELDVQHRYSKKGAVTDEY